MKAGSILPLIVLFVLSGAVPEGLQGQQKVVVLNRAVDALIRIAAKGIEQDGRDQMAIDDIKEEFKWGWSIFKVSGSFEGIGGWVRRMTTMRRMSNATLSSTPLGVTLEAAFGLDTLQLGFDRYRAKFGIASVEGEVKATVGDHSITMAILLQYDRPTCSAELTKIYVDRLDSITVDITGMWFNRLYSRLVTWFINRSKRRIIEAVNSEAWLAVTKAIDKYRICDELAGLYL